MRVIAARQDKARHDLTTYACDPILTSASPSEWSPTHVRQGLPAMQARAYSFGGTHCWGTGMIRTAIPLLTLMAIVITSHADTNSVPWPRSSDIPRFTPALLSPRVLRAAREFSERSGTNRFEQAALLDKELALGLSLAEDLDPKWLMTENDVVKLLGKADVHKAGQLLSYHVGNHNGKTHALLFFVFTNGYLHSVFKATTE